MGGAGMTVFERMQWKRKWAKRESSVTTPFWGYGWRVVTFLWKKALAGLRKSLIFMIFSDIFTYFPSNFHVEPRWCGRGGKEFTQKEFSAMFALR
jgi:hypothetical protein